MTRWSSLVTLQFKMADARAYVSSLAESYGWQATSHGRDLAAANRALFAALTLRFTDELRTCFVADACRVRIGGVLVAHVSSAVTVESIRAEQERHVALVGSEEVFASLAEFVSSVIFPATGHNVFAAVRLQEASNMLLNAASVIVPEHLLAGSAYTRLYCAPAHASCGKLIGLNRANWASVLQAYGRQEKDCGADLTAPRFFDTCKELCALFIVLLGESFALAVKETYNSSESTSECSSYSVALVHVQAWAESILQTARTTLAAESRDELVPMLAEMVVSLNEHVIASI